MNHSKIYYLKEQLHFSFHPSVNEKLDFVVAKLQFWVVLVNSDLVVEGGERVPEWNESKVERKHARPG